ncbi:MAG: RusA family crossover junction endodeoxyribonuclease [Salinarimonas sp.]
MEPEFPFEFVVLGTPVSFQRANPAARQAWKDLVRAASAEKLLEGHFATDRRLAVTMYYYPKDRMVGDIDNIIKLMLDALQQHIYLDDDQIERIVVQKFESHRRFAFIRPSPTLAACMYGPKPALYIRISAEPYEELNP